MVYSALNDELREQRKSLVLDPYAKTKLDEIDEKIGVNDRKINHSLQEIHFLRYAPETKFCFQLLKRQPPPY